MEKTKINITEEVAIHISDMNKWFGNFHVLRDINLEVRRGERIVVCGPSGSGKSTLIRCINRLEEHQKGSIIVDGTELCGLGKLRKNKLQRSQWKCLKK